MTYGLCHGGHGGCFTAPPPHCSCNVCLVAPHCPCACLGHRGLTASIITLMITKNFASAPFEMRGVSLKFIDHMVTKYGHHLNSKVASCVLKGYVLDVNANHGKPLIMGVVNMSSDSWYTTSICLSQEAAVRRAQRLSIEGACLVDIGPESTEPGAAFASEARQLDQLVPVVSKLAQKKILVSIETYHPAVARGVLEAGAAVINFTGGHSSSEEVYRIAAQNNAGVIINYHPGCDTGDTVRNTVAELSLDYDLEAGLWPRQVIPFFAKEVEKATRAGVKAIWIDLGLGFFIKSFKPNSDDRLRYQLVSMLSLFQLRALGVPVCAALPHAFHCFEEELRCAEPFFAVLATLGQCDLLRTHEVSKVKGVVSAMNTDIEQVWEHNELSTETPTELLALPSIVCHQNQDPEVVRAQLLEGIRIKQVLRTLPSRASA